MKKRLPFFFFLLFMFTACPAGATTFYLIKTSCVTQNGFIARQNAMSFALEAPLPSPFSFKPIYLHGSAFLSLPSEKKSSTRRAMLNAMAAYARRNTSVRVAATTIKNRGRVKSAVRVSSLTLFSLPDLPESISVRGYTLQVSFTAWIASVSSYALEDFFYKSPRTFLSVLLQNIKNGIMNSLCTENSYGCPAPIH